MRVGSSLLLALLGGSLGCNAVLGLEPRPERAGEGGRAAGGTTGAGGAGGEGGEAGASSVGGQGGAMGSQIGDCVVDAGETCDDCNTQSGDGCDETGNVEPGWSCPDEGEHCLRLSGFSVAVGSTLLEAGGVGGSAFEHDCGPGHMLVGVQAHNTTEEGSPALGQLRGRCAPMDLVVASFTWSTVDVVTSPQGQEPITSLGNFDCPNGGVVTGLHPRGSGGIIRGYALLCSSLVFDAGAIHTTSDDETGIIGTGPLDLPEQRCPDGTAVTAFAGRSGALIDRLTMRCDVLSPTFCGDGQLDTPFEGCDDGNVTDGDGCDSFCAIE